MNVGIRRNNPNEGRIFFTDQRPPLKCELIKGRVFIEQKCENCGANEVKDYKCAYCRKEI